MGMAKSGIGLAVLLAAALGSAVAQAGLIWTTGTVLVTKVDFETDHNGSTAEGTVWLTFSSPPGETNCSDGGSGQWFVGGTTESVRSILATATAAKLAGTHVKVLYNNSYSGTESCSGGGTTGAPILRGLELQ